MLSDIGEWCRRLSAHVLFADESLWFNAFKEGRDADKWAELIVVSASSGTMDQRLRSMQNLGGVSLKADRAAKRKARDALSATW